MTHSEVIRNRIHHSLEPTISASLSLNRLSKTAPSAWSAATTPLLPPLPRSLKRATSLKLGAASLACNSASRRRGLRCLNSGWISSNSQVNEGRADGEQQSLASLARTDLYFLRSYPRHLLLPCEDAVFPKAQDECWIFFRTPPRNTVEPSPSKHWHVVNKKCLLSLCLGATSSPFPLSLSLSLSLSLFRFFFSPSPLPLLSSYHPRDTDPHTSSPPLSDFI